MIPSHLVSKNPEILWNLMLQIQTHDVDEIAYLYIGFDKHNAFIWSFKAETLAFQGKFESNNHSVLFIGFYWLRRHFL